MLSHLLKPSVESVGPQNPILPISVLKEPNSDGLQPKSYGL